MFDPRNIDRMPAHKDIWARTDSRREVRVSEVSKMCTSVDHVLYENMDGSRIRSMTLKRFLETHKFVAQS